jgi:hypothetical protein
MFRKNMTIDYAILLIKSIRGLFSFEALGNLIKVIGDTVGRNLLKFKEKTDKGLLRIAQTFFKDKKHLHILIDDTLIHKVLSKEMVGTCWFYCTKLMRTITAYRALMMAVSDGKYTLPLKSVFMFSKELAGKKHGTKDALVQEFILLANKVFQDKQLTFVFDGLFATTNLLAWCSTNHIRIECRMHSNRTVIYRSISNQKINQIKDLIPKGRQRARTIQVVWHGIPLYITAHRRTNKHGIESIVYQASTFKVKPIEHVKHYRNRWPIEKLFRTAKQRLGLGDCFSTERAKQEAHVSSALLAYTFAVIEQASKKLDTPEDAIRALELKKPIVLQGRLNALNQIFGDVYA